MPSAQTRRGSYAVGRERRERILQAASERFATAGYARTSLAEIARDVGITTPGLVHHFPTKQHLLLGIVEHRFDVAARIAEAARGEPDGTRTLRLLLSIGEMLASQPALMELFVLVSAEAADPSTPAHALFAERYERVVSEIAALFTEEAEAGALRGDVDYQTVARECIAVSDGLQLQWVVSRGAIDLVALLRTHLLRLAPTISARPGEIRLD